IVLGRDGLQHLQNGFFFVVGGGDDAESWHRLSDLQFKKKPEWLGGNPRLPGGGGRGMPVVSTFGSPIGLHDGRCYRLAYNRVGVKDEFNHYRTSGGGNPALRRRHAPFHHDRVGDAGGIVPAVCGRTGPYRYRPVDQRFAVVRGARTEFSANRN